MVNFMKKLNHYLVLWKLFMLLMLMLLREWFDLDLFLKFKTMEYLTAHWDSYWIFETNFDLYNGPI
ncbi:hypothetical protein H8356DRAFT_1752841 [Neocallimastix lanati (nom. inval.)]|nr:hypothetical protein H8356DRAFT_1755448 [Neocallimastix sp. JGI-2020a]KAG4082549.1 hypothetical protein H8356DRAFT_1753178 [Neocallimastix sp. JGI-2020a]KAG4082700.1 hypothetical protein H8356DRAFT_1752841 [Neocallimastix sp. JGI-2020a]